MGSENSFLITGSNYDTFGDHTTKVGFARHIVVGFAKESVVWQHKFSGNFYSSYVYKYKLVNINKLS